MHQIPVTKIAGIPSIVEQLNAYHEHKEAGRPPKVSTILAPRAAIMKAMYEMRDQMPITVVELRNVEGFPPAAVRSQISTLMRYGFLAKKGKRLSAAGVQRKVMSFEFTEKGLEYARTC